MFGKTTKYLELIHLTVRPGGRGGLSYERGGDARRKF